MNVSRVALAEAKLKAHRCTFKGYGIGAAIFNPQRKEVVSDGWAHMSALRLKEIHSMHAEIHALGRARHLDLTGAVMYVFAYRKNTLATVFSMPCLTCAVAMRSAGITHAVYSTGDMTYDTLDLESDLSELKVYRGRDVE